MRKPIKRIFSCVIAAALFLNLSACQAKGNTPSQTSGNTASQAKKITTSQVEEDRTDSEEFTWDNATVYFLLTDRFCNANTANDHSYGRGLDENGNVIKDLVDSQGSFHGGDFAGVTKKINDGYFNDLGINAIWVSPPYEQVHGYVSSDGYAAYASHGYWALDFTQPDANYGTKEEFKEMVDTAHKHGIRIVMDVVLNHPGYTTMADANEYGFGEYKSGWKSYYYGSQSKLSGSAESSYLVTSSDKWKNWWGIDWIRAAEPFKNYDHGDNSTDTEQCLYGLPDFKTESTKSVSIPTFLNTKWSKEGRLEAEQKKLTDFFTKNNLKPTVLNYEVEWLTDWVREYGVDGFRCDTARHVDRSAWTELKKYSQQALDEWREKNPQKVLDKTPFWMVGEAWDHTINRDDYYTDAKFDAMINFSFYQSTRNKSKLPALYQFMDEKIHATPTCNVLSFISSHDISLYDREDLINGGDMLLMSPGAVEVYYGDESARQRQWKDCSAFDLTLRSNMNWDSTDEKVLKHWQILGKFRRRHPAVGAGKNTQISEKPYVFSRVYTDSKGVTDKVIVAFADAGKNIEISTKNVFADGTKLSNAYDGTSASAENGKVTFNSGANGVILVETC